MHVTARGIFLDFTLDTPDGEKTYSVPAAGITEGMRLAEIYTMPAAQRAKLKMTSVELFQLVLGDMWDQLATDRVPYTDAWRVGMACLGREQVLMTDNSVDRWANAAGAAKAIVEAGIDPEAVAAWTAANSGTATNRATRRAAARTTRKPASGTGTRKTKTTSRTASPSRGTASGAPGR